jgi:geranylgeranyl pyrophosphate synthase
MSTVLAARDEQFTPAQHLLRERLHTLLATLAPPLRADVTRALEAEGKLLWQPTCQGERPAGVWGLLTLLVARQVSPAINPPLATSVAIAVESYICALDLLDDIEDSDRTPVVEELGVARTLSTATTLLFLTQQALLETACYLTPEQVLRLLEALSAASLTATTGQHFDILTEERDVSSLSARECLEIVAAKSGSLMSLACRLGALCGGADHALCERWAELGKLLGISHQLDNDSHEGYDLILAACNFSPAPGREGASEGSRPKKTLPVVLAAHLYEQHRRGFSPQREEEDLRVRGLAVQEAIVLTSAKALLFRELVRERALQLAGTHLLAPALCQLLGIAVL